MSTEIIRHEENAVETTGAMTLKGIVDRVNIVHQAMRKVMQDGTHYGTIPGCGDKKVLFKPGADMLAMMFRLSPEYRIDRHELADGHREYEVTCVMRGPDGTVVGEGVGSGSTMEGKYRYRWEGKGENRHKIEHEDIADTYNTVFKMAKKRAHVDATLTCTGASDMFTQDLIDEMSPDNKPRKPVAPPKPTKSAEMIVGVVEDVEVKTGKKGEKAWTRFGIHIAGQVIGSFDAKVGEMAQANIGNEMRITYSDDGKYKTAIGIDIPEAESVPADIENQM